MALFPAPFPLSLTKLVIPLDPDYYWVRLLRETWPKDGDVQAYRGDRDALEKSREYTPPKPLNVPAVTFFQAPGGWTDPPLREVVMLCHFWADSEQGANDLLNEFLPAVTAGNGVKTIEGVVLMGIDLSDRGVLGVLRDKMQHDIFYATAEFEFGMPLFK